MVSDNKAYIIGVGMTKFIKPRDTYGYEELGLEAAVKALLIPPSIMTRLSAPLPATSMAIPLLASVHSTSLASLASPFITLTITVLRGQRHSPWAATL